MFKKEKVEEIKKRFPAGARLVVNRMNDDPDPVEPGSCGTVELVDDIGTIHCRFDNGRHIGVIPGVDQFRRIKD